MNERIILETSRCVVREFGAGDLDDLFRLYEPEEITRFVEPLFERQQEEIYQASYRKVIYGEHGFGMWAVCDKATGELIGRIGVEDQQGLPPDTVELGYIVAVSRQRQGIAYEVCESIIAYTLNNLGFTRIIAHIHPDNVASIALIKKLGFSPTDEYLNGERMWEYVLI